jgi:anti-sigma factor RsiW
MFDFLRNVTKSADEKRQEAVAAYLDGMLNDRARLRFEQEMAQDAALQAQVEQLRFVKQRLRQLPQREVPRNFILDPAKQGRPARQPWVQAYPVLRTATALAAFFFIFAVAAGIFTGFGADAQLSFAPVAGVAEPVADVAQVEEVEVTRVVAEEMESQAFQAEAADAAADEELAEEVGDAAAEMVEEMAEAESAEEAELMEEEVMESLPEIQATQPASTAASIQSSDAEESAAPLAPKETSTATASPLPTPTASDLPRVTPPTPLPNRDLTPEEAVAEADGAAAETSMRNEMDEDMLATAVPTQSPDVDSTSELASPLPWLQIGLGLLLLLLAGLTFYARRQR